MESFNCPTCGADLIFSIRGFISECEHFKLEQLDALTEREVKRLKENKPIELPWENDIT